MENDNVGIKSPRKENDFVNSFWSLMKQPFVWWLSLIPSESQWSLELSGLNWFHTCSEQWWSMIYFRQFRKWESQLEHRCKKCCEAEFHGPVFRPMWAVSSLFIVHRSLESSTFQAEGVTVFSICLGFFLSSWGIWYLFLFEHFAKLMWA